MSARQGQTAHNLALVDALGDLRHDLVQASAVLQAAICTRNGDDVRILVMMGSGAVVRAMEQLGALRELIGVRP